MWVRDLLPFEVDGTKWGNAAFNPPPPLSRYQLWNGADQGEADAAHPEVEAGLRGYNCSFPAMIADWREQWHAGTDGETDAAFPFGFVQLNSIWAKLYTRNS